MSNLIRSVRFLAIFMLCTGAMALSACGRSTSTAPVTNNSPVSNPTSAAAKSTNASAPAAAQNISPSASTPADAAASEKPAPQISETSDDSETVDDAAPSANNSPALKLTTAATADTKSVASQFKEGVNYQRLVPTQPTNATPDQVEVIEVFWYGCPHCFALDPKLEAWRHRGKANYVAFRRLPATWNDATLFHGRIFYTAEQLNKLDELHSLIFREIQVNGNPLSNEDQVRTFFAAHGVNKADFDKTFDSFGVNTKLQTAGLLNRRYRVESVPFFIVNGKYTFDVASAGGEEQVLQLINELAAHEHSN